MVAADGSGDYKTIQGAINSLSDSSATARTIFIKKGTYREKIFIEKHNIIFEGEDKEKTTIIDLLQEMNGDVIIPTTGVWLL
ncbi:MAG: hypothetical protein IPQ25_17855 [Chitinophagaceae bacterium]|nr:hypothetical protein [Chitinophagaceae bacterium]